MTEQQSHGADEPTDEELAAERDECLALLSRTSSDDPEAAEHCARVGAMSAVLFARLGAPEDLTLAAEAFELAFRTPGDTALWAVWRIRYGYVRACEYDRDEDPEVLEEALDLVCEGLAELPEGEEWGQERLLGRQLLASGSKIRVGLAEQDGDDRRAELLAESVELHQGVLPLLEPGTEEEIDLHASLGWLHLQRASGGGGDVDDAAASAEHYRAVLAAALPTSDLPLVRHSVGLALIVHGRATASREVLEEAREAFEAAVHEARRAGGRPSWAWEAEIRATFIRAMIWSTWKDQAQGAAAEAELNSLLAEPEAVDRLLPHYLDGFGRLLFERASVRGDGAGQDRAIGLLRRAVDEWQPARDGKVTAPAFFLAAFQQGRYQDDPDPERLHEVVRASTLVLEDDELSEDGLDMARMMGGWAWIKLEEHGVLPDSPEAVPDAMGMAQMTKSYWRLFDEIGQGRSFLDYSETDDDFPGLVKGTASPARLRHVFDEAYARWTAMEPGRGRAEIALGLLSHVMIFDPHGTHITAEQKTALTTCVLEADDDDPNWQRRAHAAVAHTRLWEEMTGIGGAGTDDVMDHLARASAAAGTTPAMGNAIDLTRMMATTHRGQTAGAADDVEAAGEAWQRLREDPDLSPYLRRMMDAHQAGIDAQRAVQAGDLGAADGCLDRMLRTHTDLDADDPARVELWTAIENARTGRDDLARRLGVPPGPPLMGRPTVTELRRAARRLPRDHAAWVLGDNGVTRFHRAVDDGNALALQEAMGLLREAHDMVDEGTESRLRYASCLGAAHCGLASVQANPFARSRELAQGIALLENAFRGAGGPEHRLYASTGLALARAYRTRNELRLDDRTTGRHVGLDSLRGHTWAALLQSGTDHATNAALQATAAAREVAAWCLRDNALEEAVQALDACRGLVLHAAVTSRQVPERLVAAGHRELAEEWQATGVTAEPAADPLRAARAPLTLPSALRRRVLSALTGAEGSQDRLLDPPTVQEIATALRSLRKDALVYLVPASDDAGGTAVVVTSGGDVHAVPLPRLKEDAAPLRDYAPEPAGAGRDLGPVPGGGPALRAASLRHQLERLCGWAWYAGIRPLFDAFAAPSDPGRVPRLVLVPMDALGLVPWHAAWEEGADGRRRYAVQEAEISYAASARLLCDVAARTPAEHTGSALVVGNPTGDLPYAGVEADAVQRVFYPRGTFLGRRADGTADGPGTPGDVVEWLADGGADEGGVLHLACHAAIARDARRTAHLHLYGGELAAEELTEAIGAGRSRLGLVLLAACRSHVSGRGHNEAYSLATAFLVAGARSVVGSLWPVPDDATSVLMFLTHHFLRREGETPARALRRAQLWMLDPERRPPAELPPLLAEWARRVDPHDLSAWAGFTHLGQ
ncbi:CHAT domain-containing protein [Streptomyces sp. Je 1-79]|uniref:CHAT domain-containing protein n=1 Tax=Streptomyces sp. Je 1-79 TaxID=2943847 RepID=UPI0021A3DC91|nr:CHAT domain-containing protein [Streptomyces sp. Je 1-79]MCT4355570.1 CHAT domain-containing protein [Streptomyces sp. Je 1-79]